MKSPFTKLRNYYYAKWRLAFERQHCIEVRCDKSMAKEFLKMSVNNPENYVKDEIAKKIGRYLIENRLLEIKREEDFARDEIIFRGKIIVYKP